MSDLARLLFSVALFATLVLVSWALSSSSWLWIFVAALIFLALYARAGVYAFLVIGAVLVGASVGILLEVAAHWSGAFLVSLGGAGVAIEGLEERRGHWPLIIGLAFIGLGVLVGLIDAGRFTLLLVGILAGAVALGLALRRRPG